MADTNNGGNSNAPSTEELIELLKETPFAPLLDIPNVDTQEVLKGFANAFGNGDINNPFPVGSVNPEDLPYNGNPFAGENFWNIFANGQDPTKVASGNPVTDGTPGSGNPFAGGSGNPFAGGTDNPFAGGSGNPFAGGTDNPFAGGSGNPFA